MQLSWPEFDVIKRDFASKGVKFDQSTWTKLEKSLSDLESKNMEILTTALGRITSQVDVSLDSISREFNASLVSLTDRVGSSMVTTQQIINTTVTQLEAVMDNRISTFLAAHQGDNILTYLV